MLNIVHYTLPLEEHSSPVYARAVGVRGTFLVGEIPEELGKLIALQYLYLANNKLEGECAVCKFHIRIVCKLRVM